MKTEFLRHFFKSIDKLKSTDVKNDVVDVLLMLSRQEILPKLKI